MTLGQIGILFDADRRFWDPKAAQSQSSEPEDGTALDLLTLAAMKAV